MILGVIEGQIRGGYFPDCILDPSMIDPTVESTMPQYRAARERREKRRRNKEKKKNLEKSSRRRRSQGSRGAH